MNHRERYWVHSDPHAESRPDNPPCALDCRDRAGDVRPARAPSVICGPCYARLRRQVRELWAIYDWYGREMIRTGHPTASSHDTGQQAAAGRGVYGPEEPMILALHDLRTSISEWVDAWCRWVAFHHQPVLAGPVDRLVVSRVAWLDLRLSWISRQEWVGMFAWQVAMLRLACHAVRPWRAHRRDMPVPCRSCNRLTLSLFGGDDGVTCRNPDCDADMIPWWKYERWVRQLHQEQTREPAA